jgi:hypothetical protein
MELPGCTRRATSKSVDEGGGGGAVLKHLDGVIVSCAGELGAMLGVVLDVLAQALSRPLLAVAQLPLLA